MEALSDIARALARARKPKVRRCPECGTEFITIGRGKFCSPRCASRVHSRIWYQRRKQRAGAGQ